MKQVIEVCMDEEGNTKTSFNGTLDQIQPAIVYILREFILNHPDKQEALAIVDACVYTAKEITK